MKAATRNVLEPTVTVPSIRDALLPKLLSSEIRVAEAKRLVESV